VFERELFKYKLFSIWFTISDVDESSFKNSLGWFEDEQEDEDDLDEEDDDDDDDDDDADEDGFDVMNKSSLSVWLKFVLLFMRE